MSCARSNLSARRHSAACSERDTQQYSPTLCGVGGTWPRPVRCKQGDERSRHAQTPSNVPLVEQRRREGSEQWHQQSRVGGGRERGTGNASPVDRSSLPPEDAGGDVAEQPTDDYTDRHTSHKAGSRWDRAQRSRVAGSRPADAGVEECSRSMWQGVPRAATDDGNRPAQRLDDNIGLFDFPRRQPGIDRRTNP